MTGTRRPARAARADGATPDWPAVADAFCDAWTSDRGRPRFDALARFYAPDPDVVIFDALPPIEGFRGFEAMRESIYDGLTSIAVRRSGPVEAKALADGVVVATAYPLRMSYRFDDGRAFDIDARISQVWERRDGVYVIVHEHPSTACW